MSLRARDVVGRRVVAIEQSRRSDVPGRHPFMLELGSITLDNGRRIYFMAHEQEDGACCPIEGFLTDK